MFIWPIFFSLFGGFVPFLLLFPFAALSSLTVRLCFFMQISTLRRSIGSANSCPISIHIRSVAHFFSRLPSGHCYTLEALAARPVGRPAQRKEQERMLAMNMTFCHRKWYEIAWTLWARRGNNEMNTRKEKRKNRCQQSTETEKRPGKLEKKEEANASIFGYIIRLARCDFKRDEFQHVTVNKFRSRQRSAFSFSCCCCRWILFLFIENRCATVRCCWL